MSTMEDAIRLYYRGEILEAEKILKGILWEEPDNLNALARFAAIQQELGRTEEAGAIYYKLAGISEKEGDYEECLSFLEKAAPGVPENKVLALKGKCLFHLERFPEALSNLIISPRNNQNLFYTGRTYFALNQYNNALRVFREILPDIAGTWEIFQACYWIGKSLYELDDLEEAISCFNSYISVYPDEAQVYLDLAVCYLNAGRYEEAGENLVRYRNLGGSEEVASLYLGIVNYHQGHFQEAINLLNQAPESSQALHWKGLALYELGLYEDALDCFTKASKQETRPLYYKMMGNAHMKLGNFFEAKICFEKALDIDSSDEDLEKLLSLAGQLLKSEKP